MDLTPPLPLDLPPSPVEEWRKHSAKCSPPNVLWLQFCGDGDPCDESPIDDDDVTWCRDKIFGADEMYIRAEHIMPLLERVSCNTATPAEVWEWIKALNAENATHQAPANEGHPPT